MELLHVPAPAYETIAYAYLFSHFLPLISAAAVIYALVSTAQSL